uniref:Uncharacterized protein n=1 Tax=Anguilla anguilla TaxID=7936 RepID=A0A0E9PMV8_ANGAN
MTENKCETQHPAQDHLQGVFHQTANSAHIQVRYAFLKTLQNNLFKPINCTGITHHHCHCRRTTR